MFVVVNGMFVVAAGLIFKVRRGIGAIAKLNGMYYYCFTSHDNMDDLFRHNQDRHMEIDSTFSILCGEVGAKKTFKAIHFRKRLSEFPLNCNVHLEGGWGGGINRSFKIWRCFSPPSRYGRLAETPVNGEAHI